MYILPAVLQIFIGHGHSFGCHPDICDTDCFHLPGTVDDKFMVKVKNIPGGLRSVLLYPLMKPPLSFCRCYLIIESCRRPDMSCTGIQRNHMFVLTIPSAFIELPSRAAHFSRSAGPKHEGEWFYSVEIHLPVIAGRVVGADDIYQDQSPALPVGGLGNVFDKRTIQQDGQVSIAFRRDPATHFVRIPWEKQLVDAVWQKRLADAVWEKQLVDAAWQKRLADAVWEKQLVDAAWVFGGGDGLSPTRSFIPVRGKMEAGRMRDIRYCAHAFLYFRVDAATPNSAGITRSEIVFTPIRISAI